MSKKLSTQHIIQCIQSITDTNELRTISDALHLHRNYMNAQATRNFVTGDKVEFEGRRGRTVQGIVKRVKIKNIIVEEINPNSGRGRWNVSASLLKKVA